MKSALANPAVWRLVRRGIVRNKGRTFALFMLTFLPVGFVAFTSVALFSNVREPSAESVFGNADAVVRSRPIETIVEQFPDAEIVSWSEFDVSFADTVWRVADVPIENPLLIGFGDGGPALTDLLASGRFPSADGEVALTREGAETFGSSVELGMRIPFGDVELSIVGLLRDPVRFEPHRLFVNDGAIDELAVQARSTEQITTTSLVESEELLAGINSGDTRSSLVDMTRDNFRDQPVSPFDPFDEGPDDSTFAGLFTLGLSVTTGAIAYAAWGSSARRRLRDVGLLISGGANERQSIVMQAGQGFVISLTAALAGIGVVVTGLEASGFAPSAWPIGAFASSLVVAVSVATAAAWWPAAQAARAPLTATLQGRMPNSPVALKFTLGGAAGIAAGIVLLVVSNNADGPLVTFLTGIVGLICIAIGAIPLLSRLFQVGGATRLGSQVPANLRLVLRSLARNGFRSAAATLGIGAVVAVIWIAAVDDQQQNLESVQRTTSAQPETLFGDDGAVIFDHTRSIVISGVNPEVRQALAEQVAEVTGATESITLLGYVTSQGADVLAVTTETADFPNLSRGTPIVSRGTPVGSRGTPLIEFHDVLLARNGPIAGWERVPIQDLEVVTVLDPGQLDALGGLRDHRAIIAPSSATSIDIPIEITFVRVLLWIGTVIGALVIAFVMFIVSSEVAPELATLGLLGTSRRFRQKFFATQTLVLTGAGVASGLLAGTAIRLVGSGGLPIPVAILFTLILLPVGFAAGSYLLSWRPNRGGSHTAREKLAV